MIHFMFKTNTQPTVDIHFTPFKVQGALRQWLWTVCKRQWVETKVAKLCVQDKPMLSWSHSRCGCLHNARTRLGLWTSWHDGDDGGGTFGGLAFLWEVIDTWWIPMGRKVIVFSGVVPGNLFICQRTDPHPFPCE